MKKRLRDFISYATNGNLAEFARMMKWSPQYLNVMLGQTGSIGLRPVVAILDKFPELNARWLLLGAGTMIDTDIVQRMEKKLHRLKTLEIYTPYMSVDDILSFNSGNTDFPPEKVTEWEKKYINNL